MLATAVSAANDCFFCMDSHGAFATALLENSGVIELVPLLDDIKRGSSEGFDPKMQALLHVARTVQRQPLDLTEADVDAAVAAGATDADVQLAVLIASAFSMYNRLVDGFRAKTAPSAEAYRERAAEIAEHGYSAAPPPPVAIAVRPAFSGACGKVGTPPGFHGRLGLRPGPLPLNPESPMP